MIIINNNIYINLNKFINFLSIFMKFRLYIYIYLKMNLFKK